MKSALVSVVVVLLFLFHGSDLHGQAKGATPDSEAARIVGAARDAEQLTGSSAAFGETRQREPESIAKLRRAAEAGDALAQNNLGAAHAFGRGVARSNEEAAKWFAVAAKAGFAPAQSNLGYLYEKGLGVDQDYAAALRLYRAAAEGANAQAKSRIGLFYENGWVVPLDQG